LKVLSYKQQKKKRMKTTTLLAFIVILTITVQSYRWDKDWGKCLDYKAKNYEKYRDFRRDYRDKLYKGYSLKNADVWYDYYGDEEYTALYVKDYKDKYPYKAKYAIDLNKDEMYDYHKDLTKDDYCPVWINGINDYYGKRRFMAYYTKDKCDWKDYKIELDVKEEEFYYYYYKYKSKGYVISYVSGYERKDKAWFAVIYKKMKDWKDKDYKDKDWKDKDWKDKDWKDKDYKDMDYKDKDWKGKDWKDRVVKYNLRKDELKDKYKYYKNKNYKLVWVNGYTIKYKDYYVAMWMKDKDYKDDKDYKRDDKDYKWMKDDKDDKKKKLL